MNHVYSPLQAQVVQWLVSPGDVVAPGDVVVILEAMKMEHEVHAPHAGRVTALACAAGELVGEGDLLLETEQTSTVNQAVKPEKSSTFAQPTSSLTSPAQVEPVQGGAGTAFPPAQAPVAGDVRPDLQRLFDRLASTHDASRPDAVNKRHQQGLRTARENVADLCDPGSFIEYGALAVAAQRSRRSEADLIQNTPADGMVTGMGSINSALFGPAASRAVVMAYDATVLAGTQGMRNHQKTDRMLELAHSQRLPVVLFAEGGGGRPGDVDMPIVAGLHVTTFAGMARLNGRVPTVAIVAGRCFAGNAALAGCSDVIIATDSSNLGMGGPAMIEGGGLGVYRAEEVGPAAVQHGNGVIDILVRNEQEAVAAAKHYLSFFQGSIRQWTPPDTAALRHVVPENRLRVYDSRQAMAHLVDAGSLLPLRAGFGKGIHVALGRLEGQAVGLMASNPQYLGGAIDADAADKAARFMQLCNAHGLPLVTLVDTPGFMVGPDTEATAQVRHVSRMFVAAAHLRVPVVSVVLRKGYGLGAMAMTAGGFHAPSLTAAWPTGEFGAMGLEGAVRLGYRKELAAEPDEAAREALFQRLLAQQVQAGSAVNMASTLEIDAVIDPAQTREWVLRALQGHATTPNPGTVTAIDTW